MYIWMFRLVKNTATAIGWLTTPGHSWFGKHELRQIKHLMGDLGHSHIFTVILAFAGLLTDSKDIDVSAADRPTHGPPDPAPEPTTDEFDLFQGDFMSYSQLMSQMTLD